MATGQWWIVYKIVGSGSDQEIQATYVQSASQPAVGGSVESVVGPYATEADAEAGEQSPTPTASYTGQGGITSIPGLSQIGDFFGALTQASTWIRVAEVLIGLGLIITGVSRLMSGTPIGNAAETAGKAAALL